MFTKKEHPKNSEHNSYRVGNLFSKRSADIIRVLLVNYPKTWTLRDLAKESGTSLGYASRVSSTLISQRIALRPSARSELQLMAPEDLLKRWATYAHFVANSQFFEYYSGEQDISKFLTRLKERGSGDYALTGLAGALFVEPFVRPTNTHIYVQNGSDIKRLANKLELMPIEENGNVKFTNAPSNGIFYGSQEIDGIRIVSDIQLYVDLYNYPARGREAADLLWKKIEKCWDTTQE